MMRNDGPFTKAPPPLGAPRHHQKGNVPQGNSRDAKKKHRKRFSIKKTMSASASKSDADKSRSQNMFPSVRPKWTHGRSKAIMSKPQSGKNGSLIQSSVRQGTTTTNKTVQQTAARRVSTNHHSTQDASNHHTMSRTNIKTPFKGKRLTSAHSQENVLALALGNAQAPTDGQQKRPAGMLMPKKAQDGHDGSDKDNDDSDGNTSLAGMNGVEYNAKPDIGMFGDLDDDDGDSSDDGFWENTRTIKNRSKSSGIDKQDKERSVVIIEPPPSSLKSHGKDSDTREEHTLPFPKSDENEEETADEESPPTTPSSHSTMSSPPTFPRSVLTTNKRETKENESPPNSPGSRSTISSPPNSLDSLSTTDNGERAPPPVVDTEDESNVLVSSPKKRKQDSSPSTSQGSEDSSPTKRNKPSDSGHAAIHGDNATLAPEQSPPKKARKRMVASKSTRSAAQNAGLRIGQRVYSIWKDGYHYWGVVTGGNDTTGYTILYDDDDTWDGVSRSDVLTVQMFRDQNGRYAPPLIERESDALAPRMTLEELYEVKCGACVNCEKEDCGRCASCVSNGDANRRQACLQKLCCNVSLAQKAQPMPPAANFPTGFKFIIDESRKHYARDAKAASKRHAIRKGAWGLKVLPPTGKLEFYSVEATMLKHNLEDINVEAFYQHIGATSPDSCSKATQALASTNGSLKASLPSAKASHATTPGKRTTAGNQNQRQSQSANSQTLAPREASLPKYRKVGNRVCYMEEEIEHWGTLEEKHGSGPMLSFTVRLEADNSLLERLDPTLVLSEFHYKQETGKHPPPQSRTYQEDALSSSQVSYITTKDDPLVGRKVCFSWTDLEGRKKLVYGVVSECKKNEQTGEAVSFKVIYNSKSRDLVNEINNGSVSVVPAESQMLPAALVRGGCVRYDQELGPQRQGSQLDHFWNWITPDMRHEDVVEMDSVCQPRLTLVVRGYRLELNVRKSSIAGAGNGVYVSCTPLFDEDGSDSEALVLKSGELVDLGLYGPFRVQDKKIKAVFKAKNFIFSHFCEEWAFESGDSQYQVDITDDITGDIHSEAKKRIFAYVNESDLDEHECIHAQHDAEGSVHYLLGHSKQSQGSLVIPSNGVPMEVFVSYGDEYELIRLRKGYSFLDDGTEKNRLLQEIANEDIDDMHVIYSFGAADAEAVVEFMLQLFIRDDVSQVSTSIIHRALVVAVVLQCRARQLFFDRTITPSTNENVAAAVNLKKLVSSCANLVTLLLTMIRDDCNLKMLHASGSMDKLCALVLKKQFPNMELSKSTKLEDLMS